EAARTGAGGSLRSLGGDASGSRPHHPGGSGDGGSDGGRPGIRAAAAEVFSADREGEGGEAQALPQPGPRSGGGALRRRSRPSSRSLLRRPKAEEGRMIWIGALLLLALGGDASAEARPPNPESYLASVEPSEVELGRP